MIDALIFFEIIDCKLEGCDILFIPIGDGNHWTLASVLMKEKKIIYTDSQDIAKLEDFIKKDMVEDKKKKIAKYASRIIEFFRQKDTTASIS
jgi:Ulp1 protease family, C-terminal catalytic domain